MDVPCPQSTGRGIAQVINHVSVRVDSTQLINSVLIQHRLFAGVLLKTYVVQEHIFNGFFRNTDEVGTTGAIVASTDVSNGDPPQMTRGRLGISGLYPSPILQSQEEGTPRPVNGDVLNQEVFQRAAVHHFQRYPGIGAPMLQPAGVMLHTADLAGAHQHISESPLGVRAYLQGIAAAV